MPKMPLYIVTGASGSGKTSMIKELRRIMPEYDVFDYDVIIPFLIKDKKYFDKEDTRKLQNIWLRVAQDIAECGRKTILCGIIDPEDLKRSMGFKHFRQVCFLLLHCDDRTRELRLRARSKVSDKKIQYNRKLAHSLMEYARYNKPTVPIIDTSNTEVTKVAEQISEWIRGYSIQ